MTISILCGDCRDVLRTLPAESVHCVVTSPPYWGLRDYGIASQLGMEASLGEYVETMVAVFREVRRVLRKDGTLWLNLGDSYSSHDPGGYRDGEFLNPGGRQPEGSAARNRAGTYTDLPRKNLIGIPWRVAFALQADGWWLRQDIIWSKPNPMPESVTDRCTKAHEYLFLLTKAERYFYDAEAIAEDTIKPPGSNGNFGNKNADARMVDKLTGNMAPGIEYRTKESRNKRSVWEVTTQPFSEAHFATFPPALIEPCIKAGCPKDGTVLDPFGGAGTTGLVADRLQRNAILIEIKPEYAEMAERRITSDAPLFAAVQTDDYNATDDFARSIDEAYRAIRERKANGGKGWGGWE